MRAICAEFFESETIVLTSQISTLYVVLQRAYSTYGTVWWAERTLLPGMGYIVYSPKALHLVTSERPSQDFK
jgi:hypothetical protein